MVRSESLSASMREWRKLEHERYGIFTHRLTFKCQVCGDNPHAVHLDSNCKLYRYTAAGKRWIVKVETVPGRQPTLEGVSLRRKMKLESCWLVADLRSYLKALDMYRGEIYNYPCLLQLEFPNAKFMALDTVCQYGPWLSRVDADLHSQHKTLLSVMHAKAHNWNCQWSGKNQEGAGESTGGNH